MSYVTNHSAMVLKFPLPSQPDGLTDKNKIVSPVIFQQPPQRISAVYDNINHLVEKVKYVARFILKASLSAFLYWINPSLFAMGFVAGVAFDENIQQVNRKIQEIWNHLSYPEAVVGCFFAGLSLPVTLATTTILWSAYLGALTYRKSIQNNITSSDEKLQTLSAVLIG